MHVLSLAALQLRAHELPVQHAVERRGQVVAEPLGDARLQLVERNLRDRRQVLALGLGDGQSDEFHQF